MFRTSVCTLTLSILLAVVVSTAPRAMAQSADIESWSQTHESHPAGRVYSQGDAAVARYPMSALDAANGGGLASVPAGDARARMEWALSVVSMSMAEFEMTTLSGMPAAQGVVETYDGERSFVAAFSGRAGSTREMLSVFYAPEQTFNALGGMRMLADNRPRVSVNYAADLPAAEMSANASASKTKPAVSSRPAPSVAVDVAPTRSSSSNQSRNISSGAASLLAGVKGDLEKLNQRESAKRAAAKAQKDAEAAARKMAKRERLYKASGARKGYYPAPTADEEFLVWPEQGPWRVQVPGDPASPRVATRTYAGPMAAPEAALKAFIKESGLAIKGPKSFEPMEAYFHLDGRDVRIVLAETNMGGQSGVAFLFYARAKNSPNGSLRVFEMPAGLYADWGGVAGMLTLRGVIPGVDVFPADQRARIARSPLSEQVGFYEAVLDKFYMENALALMVTQAQTTAMMTELNYDLLFGNDLTPGPWGD